MKSDRGIQEQNKMRDKFFFLKKERNQKVLHNHKQSHKFQKRENVGSFFVFLFFLFFFFAKIQKK